MAPMDTREAAAVLEAQLATYDALGYAGLRPLVDTGPHVTTATGPSGAEYQIEVLIIWDDAPGGRIRVLGGIDDGSWRAAFSPLARDLLVGPSAG